MGDMNMIVDAGACKFVTKIKAVPSEDCMSVTYVIDSDCPSVKNLASELGELESMDIISTRILDNALMKKCNELIPHPACIVPSALVKACEAACGFGVKKDASLHFE